MHLDPVYVSPEPSLPGSGLARRRWLACAGALGAAVLGSAVGWSLGGSAGAAHLEVATPAAGDPEIAWARGLARAPLGTLLEARAPFLFVLARSAEPELVVGAERLARVCDRSQSAGSGLTDAERDALARQIVAALRSSGLVHESPRAAVVLARLGVRR